MHAALLDVAIDVPLTGMPRPTAIFVRRAWR